MSHHYHGPKDRTSTWIYVPIAIVSVAVVGGVFASGFLQGGLAGKYTPVTTAPAAPTAAVNVQALAEPTPELVRAGRQLYAVNCASCHGETGYGDGTQGRGLNPPVRDFHADDSGWKNGRTVLGMWTTLDNGIPGGSMAAYRVMPAEDRMAIIHFVREVIMDDAPEVTSDEIAQLPAGGGAAAQDPEDFLILDVPENPLPIDFAMARLAQERAQGGTTR